MYINKSISLTWYIIITLLVFIFSAISLVYSLKLYIDSRDYIRIDATIIDAYNLCNENIDGEESLVAT